MAEAFLHGGQDMGVAPDFHEDDPIGVEASEVKCGCEQVTIGEAPEDRAFEPRQDAGQKHGGRRIVGQFAAARYIVKRAGRNAARGNVPVYRLYAERQHRMTHCSTFDCGDLRAEVSKGRGFTHGIR
jgi:hypothetical protein